MDGAFYADAIKPVRVTCAYNDLIRSEQGSDLDRIHSMRRVERFRLPARLRRRGLLLMHLSQRAVDQLRRSRRVHLRRP